MREARGQLSLSVVEAGIGVLLVFAVTAGFALGGPVSGDERAQLERYADDAATTLGDEPAPDRNVSLLRAVSSSPAGFEQSRAALTDRLSALLPASVLYRVETPHGVVGFPRPEGRPVGRTVAPTLAGTVTVEVWYA